MKKTITLLLTFFMAVSYAAAQGDEIRIKPEGNAFSMDIAGFNIKFGPEAEKTRVKMNFRIVGPFTFGWSCLTNDRYYGEWEGMGDFIRQKNCFTFGFSFCNAELAVSDNLMLRIGARWSNTNYKFATPVVLEDDYRGKTMPWFPEVGKDNSDCSMRHSYMGVPIGLTYETNGFSVMASVSAEGLLNGYSKWEEEDVKHYFSALNTFKSRAEVIISYNSIGAFVSYDLTPMFVPGSGNDCHLLTFGFAVVL